MEEALSLVGASVNVPLIIFPKSFLTPLFLPSSESINNNFITKKATFMFEEIK